MWGPPPGTSRTRSTRALRRRPATSRRGFLTRVAAGGAVLAAGTQVLPVTRLVPLAGAQDGGGDTTGVELDADQQLVAHLAGITLAAAQGYSRATKPDESSLSEPVAEVVRVLGAQTSQQAVALNSLLPAEVDVPNSTLVAELDASLAGATDEAAVLDVLRQLEEDLAATHYDALGALEDQNDARAVAAVLPVCGQMAVVLGSLGGVPVEELVPDTQTGEGALAVTAYPTDDTTGTTGVSEDPLGNEGGQGPNVGEPADASGSAG